MKSTLFLISIFALNLFPVHSLDFFWTNSSGDNLWTTPSNWTCSDPSATYPNNINNHSAYFPNATAGDCEINQLIQVKTLELGSSFNGILTINNVFIVRDMLEVASTDAKIIAPSSGYMGVRGSVSLQNGGNFEHNSGKFIFYGGMHNISVSAGAGDPWVLHDVQVTRGAASGSYVKLILNTGEVEIHGTTTLGGHPSTGIFFYSGLFMIHGDCVIHNVTSSVTYQDGGLCFVGNNDQTIENTLSANGENAEFSGLIGRIVIDKSGGNIEMLGAISVKREFKITTSNSANIDASNATLILACVTGVHYPDPSYNCKVNLAEPLEVDNLVINPRSNAGFEVIGDLTVVSSLETRGHRRLDFQEGTINLKGKLNHNNYFAYSTSGDPMSSGVIRFSGTSQQVMERTPINLREFKGMLPSIEIDNSYGVKIKGQFVVDGNINFIEGHFTYESIDPDTHILGLKQYGTVSNASDLSYVKGPFRQFGERLGANKLVFPIGEEDGNNKYRPIRISNFNMPNSNNPRAYTGLTARYYLKDPNILSSNYASLLGLISDCEYWKIDEYYAPWTGIIPFPLTCNIGLSQYANVNDNCDNNLYEFTNQVASLRSTGNPAIDEWISEGNGGSFALPINYDLHVSDGNVSTMSNVHDNYFTLGSDLAPCGTGPNKYYVCHNGNTLCVNINALQAHLDHGDYLGMCNAMVMKNTNETSISIHPNPNNGRFSVNIFAEQRGISKIEIFDALGKSIYQSEGSFNTVDIDISKYKNGIFLLKYSSETHQETFRLIKK